MINVNFEKGKNRFDEIFMMNTIMMTVRRFFDETNGKSQSDATDLMKVKVMKKMS